ncbi:uroporphyrinogen-III C-methyltransferase [Cryptococcus sp. DSM 104549]
MATIPQRPPAWVSYWMVFSSLIVTWDVGYCFFRPRSFTGGDLAWIWAPYNMVPYSNVDYLYGWPALESGDGFTNAQALLNVSEILLALLYVYLRYSGKSGYRPAAPLVGFAGALMTCSKTVLYFLQEWFCGWCNTGHNSAWNFWMVWVATNGTWILMPGVVSVVLGRFIAASLARDEARQTVPAGAVEKSYSLISTPPASPTATPSTTTNGLPAPLPLTFHPSSLPILIIGSNRLAATRASLFLASHARVTILSPSPLSSAHADVQALQASGAACFAQVYLPDKEERWAEVLREYGVGMVVVTDTLVSTPERRAAASAKVIAGVCTSLRIPVAVADYPALSTFSFPSTHRFDGATGQPGNLVLAVSTNGRGCRMSGRIKREVVGRLPKEVGAAVDNVGRLREMARGWVEEEGEEVGVEVEGEEPLNSPVPQLSTPSLSRRTSIEGLVDSKPANVAPSALSPAEQQLRRMRWVHQMSEYYSFEHLARMGEAEMRQALEMWGEGRGELGAEGGLPHHDAQAAVGVVAVGEKAVGASEGAGKGKGRILLIGSGPGHPGLLTMAAHTALRTATLILSDKLVPAEILALIPSTTELHIAKKFPGNAEGAQNEMMALALEGARRGEVVVRLKQGDPFVYGRGGEEVLFFREHGFESTVIPGISSALAAPLMMGIPVTQRGVAEGLVLCTGVGRQGKRVTLPGYVKSRTLVMLMGVARIRQIIEVMTAPGQEGRDGEAYPLHLPIGIIERASSPDQRVILSTLGEIEATLQKLDERPPGMMVVGWAALCLEGKGRVDVLDRGDSKEVEEGIVREWLGEQGWKVREGLSEEWKGVLAGVPT